MSLDLWESTKLSPTEVFYELKYKLVFALKKNVYVCVNIYTHSAPAVITNCSQDHRLLWTKKANMSGAQWVILNKEVYL